MISGEPREQPTSDARSDPKTTPESRNLPPIASPLEESAIKKGRSISTRGWILFGLFCAALIAIAFGYRWVQSGRVTLSPPHEFKLYGIVYSAGQKSSRPIPGATVVIESTNEQGEVERITGKTNEAGRVKLYYRPGTVVTVRISKPGYKDREEIYVRPSGVRPDEKPLRITLDPDRLHPTPESAEP